MPANGEILVTLIVEKDEPPIDSLLSPFLNQSVELDILIIDNSSLSDSLEEFSHQFPQITLHTRPRKISLAMAYNIALEIALHKGFKGVFIWDIFLDSTPLGFLQSTIPPRAVIAFEASNSLYIPIEVAQKVGLLCPLMELESAISDYLNRVKSHGFSIGHSNRQNETKTLPKDYKCLSAPKLLKPYLNLKKSLRFPVPAMDIQGIHRAYDRKKFAPVLLLVYNRPAHTKRILHDFWMQPEAPQTPLYILSDGGTGIEEVRKLCKQMAECHPNITLWLQDSNQGLAKNVTDGVQRVLEHYESVVVLEDDLRLSPYFLRWMNEALETYQTHPEVAHIHGGTFYTHPNLAHNHPLHFAGSWGWATWRDRWQKYWQPDGDHLLKQLEAHPDLQKRFDYGGYMKFTQMLRRQTRGENNSWAIRWHASLLLHQRLSINANPPLVSNDGFDGTGTHCGADDRYNTGIFPYPLYAPEESICAIKESVEAQQILLKYYRRTNNKLAKAWYKLRELLHR